MRWNSTRARSILASCRTTLLSSAGPGAPCPLWITASSASSAWRVVRRGEALSVRATAAAWRTASPAWRTGGTKAANARAQVRAYVSSRSESSSGAPCPEQLVARGGGSAREQGAVAGAASQLPSTEERGESHLPAPRQLLSRSGPQLSHSFPSERCAGRDSSANHVDGLCPAPGFATWRVCSRPCREELERVGLWRARLGGSRAVGLRRRRAESPGSVVEEQANPRVKGPGVRQAACRGGFDSIWLT